MTPRQILTKELLQIEYIENLLSVDAIAIKYNIKSHNSVTQALERHGLSRKDKRDKTDILTREFLIEHYIVQNKSLKTIAIEIGCENKLVVKNALIKHNISLRKRTYRSKKLVDYWTTKRKFPHISINYFSSLQCGAKRRCLPFEITIQDAWDVFLQQNGRCALTGEIITIREIGRDKNTQTASLDRIDSYKGYIKGNIQWIHKDINRMKMDINEEKFVEWCHKISQFKSKG